MIPVAVERVPQPNEVAVPEQIKPIEVPLWVRLLIQPLVSTATWAWNVVVLRAQKDGAALIPLFLSALGIFPLWISLAMAVGSVVAISISISNAESKASQLEITNGTLKREKQELENRCHTLLDEKSELALRQAQTQREKEDVVKERDRLIQERRNGIQEKAGISIERDELRREIEKFRENLEKNLAECEGLRREKDSALQETAELKVRYRDLLTECGKLKAQVIPENDAHRFNRMLEKFHALYEQMGQGKGGMTGMALQELIPQYKAHRENLHRMLRTSIDLLPEEDSNRIPLNGILRLSEWETDHLERLGEALHVLEMLRTVSQKA